MPTEPARAISLHVPTSKKEAPVDHRTFWQGGHGTYCDRCFLWETDLVGLEGKMAWVAHNLRSHSGPLAVAR